MEFESDESKYHKFSLPKWKITRKLTYPWVKGTPSSGGTHNKRLSCFDSVSLSCIRKTKIQSICGRNESSLNKVKSKGVIEKSFFLNKTLLVN